MTTGKSGIADYIYAGGEVRFKFEDCCAKSWRLQRVNVCTHTRRGICTSPPGLEVALEWLTFNGAASALLVCCSWGGRSTRSSLLDGGRNMAPELSRMWVYNFDTAVSRLLFAIGGGGGVCVTVGVTVGVTAGVTASIALRGG